MPFARPTLTQLIASVLGDIASSDIPGADALLRKAVLRVMGKTQAEFSHEHYGYLDWIALQAVPFSATDDKAEAWGGLVGIYRKAATFSIGPAVGTGTNGTIMPSGTQIARLDGYLFTTTADATVTGGVISAPIIAAVAGNAGNSDAGTQAVLKGSIPGIINTFTITTSGGFPTETDDALKDRYLAQFRAPPHGGDASDYVEWCLQVPGVTRAWCIGKLAGLGTVSVFTMFDDDGGTGFPSGTNGVATGENRDVAATGDLLTVANYILPLQPVTALVYSCKPQPFPINFVINDLIVPYGGAAGITSAIADVLLRKAGPSGERISPSEFEAAISAVPGISDFTLASPSTPVSAPVGFLMTVGTLTFGASL